MNRGINVRAELARLIKAGLHGRSLNELRLQLVAYFKATGLPLAKNTFYQWVDGVAFPANKRRQDALGLVVGGAAGEAIRKLPGPAFRGWRRRVMKENDEVDKHSGAVGKGMRRFPVVNRPDGSGRSCWQARIVCATPGCGFVYHHSGTGNVNSDVYFRKKGWEVGDRPEQDFCPACVEARRRKVVKMSDHKKDTAPAAPVAPAAPTTNGAAAPLADVSTMSKEDARLIFRAIEPNWDDNLARYKPGWSDLRIATEQGVAPHWVKHVREDMYGGSGEDPGVAEFVAEQVAVKDELGSLAKDLAELTQSVASSHQHTDALLGKYREKHNVLSAKIQKLQEVAQRLTPFRNAG